MKQLALILSFCLGLAFPAFASPKAGTVIEKGKIIHKEYRSYKDNNRKNVYYWEVIAAHDNIVYKCRIELELYEVGCVSLFDRGTHH